MANIKQYMKSRNEETAVYHKKLLLHRGRKGLFMLLAIIAIVISIFGYRIYLEQSVYTSYDVLTVTELLESGNMVTVPFGEYVVRYSMDGISCMDKTGSLIWGQAYEIRTPIAAVCKDYIAIASQKGNQVYIFNQSGCQGEVTTEYLILDIEVAAQGVIAVIMESDGMNYIKLYDTSATELAKIKTSLEGNGYPLDLGLSMDGKKLAVSYLDINNNALENSLVFYNYSDVGQNYTEQLVGAYTQEELGDILVPEITFVNNDTVCAFSDKKVLIFKMKEKPVLSAAIEPEEEVRSIFYDERYLGLVFQDNREGALYRMCIYDLAGNEVLNKKLYQDYKEIRFEGEQIIVNNEYSVQIYTLSGREKFSYTFDKNIELIKRIADYRYIWVTTASISEIRLK